MVLLRSPLQGSSTVCHRKALQARKTTVSDPQITRRDNSIDAARGIAIVLVVVGHALEILFYNRPDGAFSQAAFDLWRLIYSAHIPAFFVLAGMSRKPSPQAVQTRSARLVVLAMTAHLVIALPAILLTTKGHLTSPGTLLVLILRPLVLGTGFAAPSLWFLIALAGVEALWTKLQGRTWLVATTVAALTGLALLCPQTVPNLWSFKDLGPGLTFYALGAALRDAPKRRFVQVTALAALCWVLATAANKGCYLPKTGWCSLPGLNGQFAPMMAIGAYGDYRLFLASAIGGALAILGAGVAAARSPASKAAGWAGRNSLNIYLINGTALAIANPLLKTAPLGPDSNAAVLAITIAAVIAHGAAANALREPLQAFQQASYRLADQLMQGKERRQSLA